MLLGLPVIPKSAFITLTVASGDANRLPLAAWLVVTFWDICRVEGCWKLNNAEFESTSNSARCGYKIKSKVPVSSENSTLSPNIRYNPDASIYKVE